MFSSAGSNSTLRKRRSRRRHGCARRQQPLSRLPFEALEERIVLSVTDLGSLALDPDTGIAEFTGSGSLATPGEVHYFKFGINDPVRATIEVAGEGDLDSKLTLFAGLNTADPPAALTRLAESDDRALNNGNSHLDMHLRPGQDGEGAYDEAYYYVAVSSPAPGSSLTSVGSYQLSIHLAAATPLFEELSGFETPAGTTVADFNEDGISDLAISNRNAGVVSIFFGLGDGSFYSPSNQYGANLTFPAGAGAKAMAAADFNGDLHVDLAVTNKVSEDAWILLGNGQGGFEYFDKYQVGSNPWGVVTADLDGDQDLDLAVVNGDSDSVTVLLNSADRSGVGSQWDGFDLAEPHSGKTEVDTIAVGGNPRDIIASDFDHDGDVDLATTGRTSDDVAVWLNGGIGGKGNFDVLPKRYGNGEITSACGLVAGHFNDDNGDGNIDDRDHIDIAVASDKAEKTVTILLGNGEGEFSMLTDNRGAIRRFAVGTDAERIAAGDFDKDGILDLIVSNEGFAGDLSVLLGRGDGTFADEFRVRVGSDPQQFTVGHFNDDNGDGAFDDRDVLDLVVPNRGSHTVSVLLGRGDGTFFARPCNVVGQDPEAIVIADFNGDGNGDVATANRVSDDVSVLFGLGHGAFKPAVSFEVGEGPVALIAEDLNGDGYVDLATKNAYSHDYSVLLWSWRTGTFVRGKERDLSSWFDGLPDTASDSPPAEPAEGRFQPESVLAADVNGDGAMDLVTTASFVKEISVRLGHKKEDGSYTFGPEIRSRTPEEGPEHMVAGFFDGDSYLDLAVDYPSEDRISVLLGNGDGTFRASEEETIDVGSTPEFVVAGQFNDDNGDGTADDRDYLDLAVANNGEGTIWVFLRHSDGTFAEPNDTPQEISVGGGPRRIAVSDVDQDGHLDLAVTNNDDATVSVLWGDGTGTFHETLSDDGTPLRYPTGTDPLDIVVGHFNSDQYLDLATVNQQGGTVSIVLGEGNRRFETAYTIDDRISNILPRALVAADFDGDRIADLAVANWLTDDVVLFKGGSNEGGASWFTPQVPISVGVSPLHAFAADVDGDQWIDLLITNQHSNDISVLLNETDQANGGSTVYAFGEHKYLVGGAPEAQAQGDLDADGKQVTVTATWSNEVTVDGPAGPADVQGRGPLIADLNGDGLPDAVTLTSRGQILVRLQRLGNSGEVVFERPYMVREISGEVSGAPILAQDIAVVTTRTGTGPAERRLAVLGQSSNSLTVYTLDFSQGVRAQQPSVIETGLDTHRVVAVDLDRDGNDDLVTLNLADDTVSFFRQNANGLFDGQPRIHVGADPWDIQPVARQAVGSETIDLVVVNRGSSDMSWLMNDGHGRFSEQLRIRAGSLVYDVLWQDDRATVLSREEASRIASGDFNEDGVLDIVITSGVSSRAATLFGKPSGGFVDPVPFLLPGVAIDIATAHFDADGHLDLALLLAKGGEIAILRGDAAGGFAFSSGDVFAAGDAASSFAVHDIDADSYPDLLVTNAFGDVLELRGERDGKFAPFRRVDRTVTLDVADLNGDGTNDVVVGNASRDRVQVWLAGADGLVEVFAQGDEDGPSSKNGLAAPAAVQFVDVDRDGLQDLIVANSSNTNYGGDLFVYRGLGNGTYSEEQRYAFPSDNASPAGPVGITAIDLDADGYLDLVVSNLASDSVGVLMNRGFSVLMNSGFSREGAWLGFRAQAQTQLATKGYGPVSTAVQDVDGDGLLDLLVTNSQSGTIELWYGAGDGLFASTPQIITLPGPTGRQGTEYAQNDAFVVLADGTIAHFRLSDLGAPGLVDRMVIEPRSGAVPIVEVTSLDVWDVNADQEPELFVVGFDAEGQPLAALFAGASSGTAYELQRWSTAGLVAPGDLEVRQLRLGLFELFIAQDSDLTPLLRLVVDTAPFFGPMAALAGASPSLLAVAGFALPETFVQAIDEMLGIDAAGAELDGTGFTAVMAAVAGTLASVVEAVVTIVQQVGEVYSAAVRLLADMVDTVLGFGLGTAGHGLTRLVDVGQAFAQLGLPGSTALDLAWRAWTQQDLGSTPPPETAVAGTGSEVEGELAADHLAALRAEIARLAEGVDPLDYLPQPEAVDTAMVELAQWIADDVTRAESILVEQVIGCVKSGLKHAPLERQKETLVTDHARTNTILNVVEGLLACGGTGGLAWNIYENHKRRRVWPASGISSRRTQ